MLARVTPSGHAQGGQSSGAARLQCVRQHMIVAGIYENRLKTEVAQGTIC